MKYVTEGYEPKQILQYFEDIAAIPRESGNEAAVAQYLYDWGKNLGLYVWKDEYNNVIIRKPASPGCENAPIVILSKKNVVQIPSAKNKVFLNKIELFKLSSFKISTLLFDNMLK